MKRWPKGTWMRLNSPDTLKALMKQKNYSLERMARYAGCSRGFISHLTSGRKNSCSAPLAEQIAEALDVPLDILFTRSESIDGRSYPKHKGRKARAA